MNLSYLNKAGFKAQQGVTALLMSLIILTLITMVSLMTAKTVSVEQKISGNELRSRQAFEAAEAGIEAARTYIDKVNGGPDRAVSGTVDANIFTLNVDGVTTELAALNTVGTQSVHNITDASANLSGSVTVTMTDASPGSDMSLIFVSSVGLSADGTATRTISLLMPVISSIPNVPVNPVISRGKVTISSGATAFNVFNPEGNTTLWVGETVSLGTSSSTYTEIEPPEGSPCLLDVPPCTSVKASDTAQIGVDIIDSEGSLAELTTDQLFYNIFGMGLEAYKQDVIDTQTTSANYSSVVDHAKNRFIYIDDSADIDEGDIEVFGCASADFEVNDTPDSCSNLSPGVLIVEGDLEITDEASYFGLIYVTGDLGVSDNVEIQGAVAVGGDIIHTGGSLSVYYDSSILTQVVNNAPKSAAAGTWRDFE